MGNEARTPGRPVRVMQSFRAPRSTSNPYIHLLDEALENTAGVEHLRFSRRRALFGRYDALHLHWPDTLFGGSTRPRRLARRAFALALRARLTLTDVAVVRTMHNLELHEEAPPWQRRYLDWIERRADHRIILNELTAAPGTASTLIKHGHYRDWFASIPAADPTPGALGFVGLVRPYKGVEELIEAFMETAGSAPELQLRIAGRPTSEAIEQEIRRRASADARIVLDLRYLSERDFANAVTRSVGVVLPYRSMHNSGAALAALSLGRPVLVPRNEINEALSAEVGAGWISMFENGLDGERLRRFAVTCGRPPTTPPDLTARGWQDVGAAHLSAFREAIAHRRGGRST